MVKALRTSVRSGGLRQGGLQPGIGSDNIFATASLDLDFARHKNLGQRVDATTGSNLVDFTRASSGTYVGSDGLIKTATTNLLTYSEEFDNASWSKYQASITANSTTAPDGSLTADKFIGSNGTALPRVFNNVSGTGIYTFSVYAKAAEADCVFVSLYTGTTYKHLYYDLTNEAVVSLTASDYSVENVGNGWFRLSVTDNTTSPFFNLSFGLSDDTLSNTGASYTGDGTSGIYIWGAQLEQSDTVGEYVKTTSTINSAPRFDHDPTTGESLGLLVEESRTNSIRNNTMVGAVAGTPGTLPTNWSGAGSAFGLTREIVGTGIDNGINYFDIRLSGTASSNYVAFYAAEANNAISAAQNDVWTFSVYAKLQSGSLSGVSSILLRLDEINSSVVFISGAAEAITPTSANLIEQRATVTKTFSDPSVAYAFSGIRIQINSGSTVDFTLRIGLPQLEKGAFATSVIPTSTATVTRAADVASITGSNFSSWYRQDEGTIYHLYKPFGVASGRRVFSLDDGSGDNRYLGAASNSSGSSGNYIEVTSGGVAQGFLGTEDAYTETEQSGAFAYILNNAGFSKNGSTASLDSSVLIPTINTLNIGSDFNNTAVLNGHIRRLVYWDQRLPNEVLQTITL